MLFAPIFRASNLPLPLLVLELLSLIILFLVFLDPEGGKKLSRNQLLLMGGILLLPALFLIPLPMDIWTLLPGRELYGMILQQGAADASSTWRSISIVGQITEHALWALVPPLVVFVATINQSRRNIQRLVYVVIGIAVFQSVLGLMQFGEGANSPLYFGNEYGNGSATGTYLNRDHLAGFLEMIFPIVFALFAATVGHHFDGSKRRSRWRKRMEFFSSVAGHRAIIFGGIGVLIVLALIFTRSR
ncbi:MAG TPA: O-antigen ligase domain-containing protein, partial [Thiolapillus brandeum]|nr:O-antigen ligase domain-containing protein [Thiolapillus brandeum]